MFMCVGWWSTYARAPGCKKDRKGRLCNKCRFCVKRRQENFFREIPCVIQMPAGPSLSLLLDGASSLFPLMSTYTRNSAFTLTSFYMYEQIQ